MRTRRATSFARPMDRRSRPARIDAILTVAIIEWTRSKAYAAREMTMAKKRETDEKIPQSVKDIARIIEKGLERFSPEERSARLDKIHLILAGAKD